MATLMDHDDADLRSRAEAWMDGNPRVMSMFELFALDLAARGRRFGIALIAERVRWECAITPEMRDEFKINNNWKAYIARRLFEQHPKLRNHMTVRATRS